MTFAITCPVPVGDGDCILLAHGEGARLTRRLIRQELLAAFGNPFLAPLSDAATLPDLGGRLVMTTDSSVVSPLFFPGGDIGKLAIHGAVNDLAVSGADPLYLSIALILEEGLPLETFRKVVRSMKEAAEACGVAIVTGDTKVVPRGMADQLFVCTTGVGRLRAGVELGMDQIRPGDRVLVSGTLGDHGLTILGVREDFGFGEQLRSDTAPVHDLVAQLLKSGAGVRFLRDPTRGGVASVLHEVVEATRRSVYVDETAIPVSAEARGACELLGLDPLHIANEGKIVAIVSAETAHLALQSLRKHPLGQRAAIIGTVRDTDSAQVLLANSFGQLRVLDEPSGAPLPRIC